MNKIWIKDSHNSAAFFRDGCPEPDEKMRVIRILDVVGMFETGWLLFNHPYNKYGYPSK